jgi:hypothetical protein
MMALCWCDRIFKQFHAAKQENISEFRVWMSACTFIYSTCDCHIIFTGIVPHTDIYLL